MSERKYVRFRMVRAKRAGEKPVSGEYQVVRGRIVLSRHDLLEQALKIHPDAQPDESCS